MDGPKDPVRGDGARPPAEEGMARAERWSDDTFWDEPVFVDEEEDFPFAGAPGEPARGGAGDQEAGPDGGPSAATEVSGDGTQERVDGEARSVAFSTDEPERGGIPEQPAAVGDGPSAPHAALGDDSEVFEDAGGSGDAEAASFALSPGDGAPASTVAPGDAVVCEDVGISGDGEAPSRVSCPVDGLLPGGGEPDRAPAMETARADVASTHGSGPAAGAPGAEPVAPAAGPGEGSAFALVSPPEAAGGQGVGGAGEWAAILRRVRSFLLAHPDQVHGLEASVLVALLRVVAHGEEWVQLAVYAAKITRDESWGEAVIEVLRAEAARLASLVCAAWRSEDLVAVFGGRVPEIARLAESSHALAAGRALHINDLVVLLGASDAGSAEMARLRAEIEILRGGMGARFADRHLAASAPWLKALFEALSSISGVEILVPDATAPLDWTGHRESIGDAAGYAFVAVATVDAHARAQDKRQRAAWTQGTPAGSVKGKEPLIESPTVVEDISHSAESVVLSANRTAIGVVRGQDVRLAPGKDAGGEVEIVIRPNLPLTQYVSLVPSMVEARTAGLAAQLDVGSFANLIFVPAPVAARVGELPRALRDRCRLVSADASAASALDAALDLLGIGGPGSRGVSS